MATVILPGTKGSRARTVPITTAEQFLDRIADTDVPSIVTAYEKRIRDLEERKIILAARIAKLRPRAGRLRRRT